MVHPMSSAVEYNQPAICPYELSRMVNITVGNKKYLLPETYIPKHSLSDARQSQSRILLADVDADIGHTILHFLYKGEYETIAYPGTQSDTSRVELEYRRSLQVYYASRKYKIHGLELLARNHIRTFGDFLSISQLLQGAKLIYAKLPEDEQWFHDYLSSKLSITIAKDEATFQQNEFYDEVMGDAVFSKAVMKIVVKELTLKSSELQKPPESTGSGNGPTEACCGKIFSESQYRTTKENNGDLRPDVPSGQDHVAKAQFTFDEQRPCGKSPIEVVRLESEKTISKARYSQEWDDDWDCTLAVPSKNKQMKRSAQKPESRHV
ncbi:uncharacterized protein BO97DRAFT_357989 [Aspergillus homomorphus CBS 101889]|uniref:BTB domain-containing protein n=1 Tax=Aspergillus homomorphus (strain CBS 101889) TaxID=1450537 RepID=A0A395HI01_ASPHC|nr:hypothetical protein BO97DRAFT_357989 [Aspergillus homomorphus CBS 101889]RAL06795.1 hypothetical protein BO97DRAFT_357989 [Aspergillus homomorphus CBS 101889]